MCNNAMTEDLQYKIKEALNVLKIGARNKTVELCYSGGKDSDIILELAKMAGISFVPIYKNTTIDPPGTIMHCIKNGVRVVQPKKGKGFFKLIEESGFPTMRARFCCDELKEYKIMDDAVQGIRRCESRKRAENYSADDPITCRVYGSKSNHVNVILPILEWTDADVENFIAVRNIKCHPLYYSDTGAFCVKKRLGCMGCPLSISNAKKDFAQYPKLARLWIKHGLVWWNSHPGIKSREKFESVYDLFFHNFYFKSYNDYVAAKYGFFGNLDFKEVFDLKYGRIL